MSIENLRPNKQPARNDSEAVERLFRILKLLRKECPWDKKQTFESLRTLTIEETFELSEAIVRKDWDDVKKELGDVMLHIAFYAELGRESGMFDFTAAVNSLCEKLIRRHPHIFSDVEVQNEEQVKENWEAIKLKEGKKHSVLSGVPSSLPAMIKAFRIQDKARGVGFDWEDPEQAWEKVLEEIKEFRTEADKWKKVREENDAEQKARTLDELGDIFFALINYARLVKLNPEDALEHTNRKFIERFTYMEEQTIGKGLNLHDMTLEEMDKYWEEAKRVSGNKES